MPGSISTVFLCLPSFDFWNLISGMLLFPLGFHNLFIACGNVVCRTRRRRINITLCAGGQREREQCKSQEQYDVFHIRLPQNNDAIAHFVLHSSFFLRLLRKQAVACWINANSSTALIFFRACWNALRSADLHFPEPLNRNNLLQRVTSVPLKPLNFAFQQRN